MALRRLPPSAYGPLGRVHPLTAGLQPTLKVMQWHHAEVTKLPQGAEILASSATTQVQVMSVGHEILATQFHGELTPALIDRWAHIPQYLKWLDAAMGPNAYAKVKADSRLTLPRIERMSRTMFDNIVSARRPIRAAA